MRILLLIYNLIGTISNATVDNDKHSCQEFMHVYAYSRVWASCHSSDLEEELEVAVVLAEHSLLGWSPPHFAQRWA